MAERIYVRNGAGGLEPLEEKPFPSEDALQALLAEHPELLDGEQRGITESCGSGIGA